MLRLSRCLSGLSVPFDMNPMYFFLWRDGPVAGTTKSLVSFLSRSPWEAFGTFLN